MLMKQLQDISRKAKEIKDTSSLHKNYLTEFQLSISLAYLRSNGSKLWCPNLEFYSFGPSIRNIE
jgi:hypothetical protein